ncbi:MAG: hypothetical protein WBF43_08965, partial [Methylocella sp.]
ISTYIRIFGIAFSLMTVTSVLCVLGIFIFTSRQKDVIRDEVVADIKFTRQEVAKEFVSAVVSCISPQIVPDQIPRSTNWTNAL